GCGVCLLAISSSFSIQCKPVTRDADVWHRAGHIATHVAVADVGESLAGRAFCWRRRSGFRGPQHAYRRSPWGHSTGGRTSGYGGAVSSSEQAGSIPYPAAALARIAGNPAWSSTLR